MRALEAQGHYPTRIHLVFEHPGEAGRQPRVWRAETSGSWTLGFVVTPDLANRFPVLGVDLSMAFDYYNIDLKNSISRDSARVQNSVPLLQLP